MSRGKGYESYASTAILPTAKGAAVRFQEHTRKLPVADLRIAAETRLKSGERSAKPW